MSGILIKHLKMPKIGEKRTLVIDGNGDVYVDGSMGHQRLVDYAVELPSDDLISKDKLLELEMPDRCDRWIDRHLSDGDCDKAYEQGWEDLMTEISIAISVVKGETE